jgi:hypothetical protein
MAWLQRPRRLIKVEGNTSAFWDTTLITVENVSWKQISIIYQNHYQILFLVYRTASLDDEANLEARLTDWTMPFCFKP